MRMRMPETLRIPQCTGDGNMTQNAFGRQTLALTSRELKHWYRKKMQVLMIIIQPLIWLGLIGKMLSGTIGPLIPVFFTVFALGMVTVTALTTAMSSGMSLIWDRKFGFLDKMCAAPISRGAILLSRVLATTVKAVIQCTAVFVVGLALGMKISAFGPWSVPIALLAIIGVSFIFSTVFIIFGMFMRVQESFMGINVLLMLPIILVSGAILPLNMMRSDGVFGDALLILAKCNPLTWASDAMRAAFMSEDALHPIGMSWPSIMALPEIASGTIILMLMTVAVAILVWGMILFERMLTSK